MKVDPNNRKSFVLRPTILALGDFHPTLEWILAQLEFKPESIPEVIHQRVVSLLEIFLKRSRDASAFCDANFK